MQAACFPSHSRLDAWISGAIHSPQAQLPVSHQEGARLGSPSHTQRPATSSGLISQDAARMLCHAFPDTLGRALKPFLAQPTGLPSFPALLELRSPAESRPHSGARHHRGSAGPCAKIPLLQDPSPPWHGRITLVPCGIYPRDGQGEEPPGPPGAAGRAHIKAPGLYPGSRRSLPFPAGFPSRSLCPHQQNRV